MTTTRLRALLTTALMGLLVLGLAVGANAPGRIRSTHLRTVAASSPFLALPWGVYTGNRDPLNTAWLNASPALRQQLDPVYQRPRMLWFGSWNADADIYGAVQGYIANSQNGNPDALVQMALFREWGNYGENGKRTPLSPGEQASYRQWMDNVAAAIGNARTAIVLEPDLPLALKGWSPATRLALVRYAAQRLSQLPRTAVYIDAGSGDWMRKKQWVKMLKAAGIGYTRGFAFGATHYNTTAMDIGAANVLLRALAKAGVPGKHYVVDTVDNGQGFTWGQYRKLHPGGNFDNAETCTWRGQPLCDTLGFPPSPYTADPASCDGYLWYGRPWLTNQAWPLDINRAIAIGATTPY